MALLHLVAVLAIPESGDEALSSLPRSVAQAEQPQPRPAAPSSPQGGTHEVFEFGRVQAAVRLGLIAFSEDFESDPQFLAGLGARVDWPWMSRDVFGFDQDRVGLYMDLSFSRIERDVDFLDDDSGSLFFAGLGADLNLYEDESFFFRIQAGGQFGYFGGVDETENGVAAVVGWDTGVKLAENLAILFNPQAAFGHAGDQVYFISVDFQYRF